ncbi:MAG: ACP phosphodiesterase [Xanthomonadales bacterium]|nr:ACP phosphodiesterase [Xanthomonadales bacterium]
MNYLAHFLLAENNEQWRLGVLLGDVVKGRLDEQTWPALVCDGIQHHRAVDRWTDSHELVDTARELAPKPLRRYMGIVFDLMLDAWLSRHWQDWHDRPLAQFSADLYALMNRHHPQLPARLQRFSRYAQEYQVLSRYHEDAVMDRVLAGVASRLSRPGPLSDARRLLAPNQKQLDACFARFWPQAVHWSGQWVAELQATNKARAHR